MYFLWPSRENHTHPIWVASHSPISRFDMDCQIKLFKKYVKFGVSLITTGCITPNWNISEMKGPIIRLVAYRSKYKSPEGFFLFGPWDSNVLPANVGVKLIKRLTTEISIPIVANIGGFGTDKNWIRLIDELINAGVSAFEIANVCPNLVRPGGSIDLINEGLKVAKIIQKKTNLPISLKLNPSLSYERIQEIVNKCYRFGITQLTVFDVPKSICPPIINNGLYPPFQNFDGLCFGGAHGPWDRFILYRYVAILRLLIDSLEDCNLRISAVGGITTSDQAIEMLALGANSIQLSSVVFWKGVSMVSKIIKEVKYFLEKQKNSIKKRNNTIFNSIKVFENPTEGLIELYGENYLNKWMNSNLKPTTDFEKCIKCKLCCEIPCFARTFSDGIPKYSEVLCSGCGWCTEICPEKAIKME